MDNKLCDFIDMSKYAGMREDLVQAGGGNSSVKLTNSKMLIKASGFQLAELSENVGYCEVNHRIIVEYFNQDNFEISEAARKKFLVLRCFFAEGILQRPSIETFLHSITKKYTLHTHPTVVNMLASTESGWKTLKNLFPNSLFVEYETPGIKLAVKYFESFKAFGKNADTILLKNHGLVVSSDAADSVIQKTEAVLSKIEEFLHLDMSRYHNATKIYDVIRAIPELKDKIVYLSQSADVLKGIEKFGSELWDYQFCPDCIVYCGKRILSLSDDFSESDFTNHFSRCGNPVILAYKGNAYILADSMKKAKDIESVLAFSAQVALANQNEKMNLLSKDEQNFLLNWDAEKYRQQMK